MTRKADLDLAFHEDVMEIGRLYVNLPKPERIRVEKWVDKLCQPVTLEPWKKNRNEYAALLLHQVRQEKLEEPFHRLASPGELPTLPFHLSLVAKKSTPSHTPSRPTSNTREEQLRAAQQMIEVYSPQRMPDLPSYESLRENSEGRPNGDARADLYQGSYARSHTSSKQSSVHNTPGSLREEGHNRSSANTVRSTPRTPARSGGVGSASKVNAVNRSLAQTPVSSHTPSKGKTSSSSFYGDAEEDEAISRISQSARQWGKNRIDGQHLAKGAGAARSYKMRCEELEEKLQRAEETIIQQARLIEAYEKQLHAVNSEKNEEKRHLASFYKEALEDLALEKQKLEEQTQIKQQELIRQHNGDVDQLRSEFERLRGTLEQRTQLERDTDDEVVKKLEKLKEEAARRMQMAA